MRRFFSIFAILGLFISGCAQAKDVQPPPVLESNAADVAPPAGKNLQKATFAGGCFWCTEAIFQELEGVYTVVSGYTGGEVENPGYKAVCSGTTGHAEAVQIEFDPEQVTYEELLNVHFKTHDPTTLNRQGADRGTQYRSGIYYHNDEQKKAVEGIVAALEAEEIYPDPIVTEIAEARVFYAAEAEHQDYYQNNTQQGYCQFVITPKVEKFRKIFAERIKGAKAKK